MALLEEGAKWGDAHAMKKMVAEKLKAKVKGGMFQEPTMMLPRNNQMSCAEGIAESQSSYPHHEGAHVRQICRHKEQ